MKKENESAHQPAMTKYMRIYTDTKNLILSGHYRDGDQLPEEAAVCEKYGCSRMTVKKAYDMLVADGFIYRKQGQGSFVLSSSSNRDGMELQERELQGFTRSNESTRNGQVSSKVLRFQLIFAPEDIAEILGIEKNAPLYDILRIGRDRPETAHEVRLWSKSRSIIESSHTRAVCSVSVSLNSRSLAIIKCRKCIFRLTRRQFSEQETNSRPS